MKSKISLLSVLSFVFLPILVVQAQDVDVPGNLTMVDSTATTGNILKGGVLFLHNFGTNNTFLGQNAGNLTMTGERNTGTGASALSNNTSGGFNTAIGFGALFGNTTGDRNTASGYLALASNTTGFNNTAIGSGALFGNSTGGRNTAIGAGGALGSNTTGSNNTAGGDSALNSNSTGDRNTAYGSGALRDNGIGSNNTASGDSALVFNTSGESNTASGVGALFHNTTGSFNTAIGYVADVSVADLTNATAIGANAVVDASNKIRLGDTSVEVIEGQVPYTFTSDRNQKENFRPVDGEQVLRKIGGLSLTSWNYIGHEPKQFRHYGPVAQEFFAAFGHDGVGAVGTDTTINSGDMEGILMIAVQALEKRTAELGALKAEDADLKARLEKLERAVSSYVLVQKAE